MMPRKSSLLSVLIEKVDTAHSVGLTSQPSPKPQTFSAFVASPALRLLICEDGRFDITSVEDIKSRGMYTEVLAKKVVSTIGKG